MIGNCGNCEESRADLCRVAFDAYETKFVAAQDRVKIDAFTQLQAFRAIGDIMLGDETAVDRLTDLSDPAIVEEARSTHAELLQSLENIGCELPEDKIAVKAMIGSIQRAYLEKASTETTTLSLFAESREPLLSTLVPVERIGSQDVPPVTEVHDFVASLSDKKEDDRKRAREEYIASQGWDPKNLNFSQELELKMHLKSRNR